MENNEYNFLFLMNKCVLLFNYIDIYYQKEVLTDIKYFIKRLCDIYETKKFNSVHDKKHSVLNVLNKYLTKIIDEKIIFLVDNQDDNFITTINNSVLKTCNEIYKKKEIEEKYNINKTSNDNLNDKLNYKISEKLSNTENIIKEGIKEEIKQNMTVKNDETLLIPENQKKYLNEFEKKIDNKIKNIFIDIENNIKLSLKDYIEYTIHIKNDVDRKNDLQIKSLNTLVDNKLSKVLENLFEDEDLNKRIINNVKTEMNDLYKYIDDIFINVDEKMNNFEKVLDENNKKINTTISNTIEIINNNINNNTHKNIDDINSNIEGINSRVNNLSNSFNVQLENVLKNICNLFIEKNNDLYNRINSEKNNYQIVFDKNDNIVKLMYNEEEVSSTKINIKGLMGPKGQQGNQGDKGDTPIIKDISLTDDNKIKFVIYDGNNIYEVVSNNTIPLGPQGIQGERGPAGKTYVDLNWKQESVMRLDEDNNNNLVILKSLSIGERSHCLKENSIAVGGSQCYKENSFSLGYNSKTLDNNSIALYGSTIGNNAFAYRADNVDENSIVFGKNEKGIYNIDKINLNSREINLDCDVLNIKAKNMYISKIKELEEKIISMDKKINDLIKKK
jgi:hypothetical protein